MAAPALVSRLNDCRSCYKCIRACPTKSISFSDGHAQIVQGECVYCGRCYIACPQDCKIVRDDLLAAKRLVMEGEVYVSLAPSFQAAFPCTSFEALEKGLLDLGFKGVEETAVGATIVKKEYERLVKEGKEDILISTCCHSVNLLVEKHFPAAKKYLAPVLSPMLAHGLDLKKRHPGAKVVFVGPCISKKDEIDRYPGPVLIVHGSADEGVPLSDSEAAVARYRNARLVVIPDDDHCYHQHLDQAVAAVREFVAAL